MHFILNPYRYYVPAGGVTLPSITNCVAFYDARDTQSGSEPSNATSLSSWQDLSGNGYTLSQGTGANQPTYYTNIQNSNPGVNWDGSNDFMESTASVVSQPFTIAILMNPDAGSRYPIHAVNNDAAIRDNGSGADSGLFSLAAGTIRDSDVSYSSGAQNLIAGFSTGDAGTFIRLDGVDGSINTSIGTQGWDETLVGARGNRDPYDRFFDGYMFVIAIYSKLWDSTDISTWETWASSNWNL